MKIRFNNLPQFTNATRSGFLGSIPGETSSGRGFDGRGRGRGIGDQGGRGIGDRGGQGIGGRGGRGIGGRGGQGIGGRGGRGIGDRGGRGMVVEVVGELVVENVVVGLLSLKNNSTLRLMTTITTIEGQ